MQNERRNPLRSAIGRRGHAAPFVCAALFAICGSGFGLGADADWPVYRHDLRLTGTTRAKGSIAHPRVRWSHYLGAPVQPFVATRSLAEPAYDLAADGSLERVRVERQSLDIHSLSGASLGSVHVAGRPLSGRPLVTKIFPDRPGQQVVLFSNKMDTGEGQGYCFTFDRGAARGQLAWTTAPLTSQYLPTRVVDDVDGDGRPEIVVAPHYRVQIFDALTGALKAEIPWDVGRNYGFLGTAIAANGRNKDVFIVCDFVPHVDCIRLRDGKWTHAWGHKYFDPNSAMPRGRELVLRVGPNPVTDLDGDGHVEMTYMLADTTTDGRWHLRVRDGENGRVKFDVPGIWLWSIHDLDGDGRCELVYTPTGDRRPTAFCDLHVANLTSKGLQDRAVLKAVRPVLTQIELPPSRDTIADEGRVDLLWTDANADGIQEMTVARAAPGQKGEDRLSAIQLNQNGALETVWDFHRLGHRLNLLRAESGPARSFEATIRDFDTATDLSLDSRGRVLREMPFGAPAGFTTTPIAADLDGDGRNEVLVQTAAGVVQALRFANGRKSPEVVWSLPGAAMNSHPGFAGHGELSVQAGDVDGDGRPEVLFAAEAENGQSSLVCADGRGQIRWRHVFERCPWGGVQAGVNFWTFGRFSGRQKGFDVYVDFHRRSRISNEACVLSGVDGRMLWERQGLVAAETAMPFGGGIPAVADVNGDGADDLVSMFWSVFASVSGKTGEPIFPPAYLLNKKYFGRWIGYSWPTLADLEGNGSLQVYLNSRENSAGAFAAVKVDGKPLWSEFQSFDTGPSGFAAVGDLDGDGRPEIAIPTRDGTLVCLDGKTGKRRWTAPVGAQGDLIAADVDGDGRIDLVFPTSDGRMVAVRGKDGTKLWSIPAPGRPIAADVDGVGLLELLAVGPDGVLRIIGDANHSP